MPVFDDPGKELRRLQQELLAEEDEELDDLLEEYGEEDYESFFQEDYEDEYDQKPFFRNFANGYRSDTVYVEDEDEEDEPFALFKDEKRGSRKLKVILLLEVIGILAILIWWVVIHL